MLGTNIVFVWPPHIQQWPTMAKKCPTMLAFVGINVGIVWPGRKKMFLRQFDGCIHFSQLLINEEVKLQTMHTFSTMGNYTSSKAGQFPKKDDKQMFFKGPTIGPDSRFGVW